MNNFFKTSSNQNLPILKVWENSPYSHFFGNTNFMDINRPFFFKGDDVFWTSKDGSVSKLCDLESSHLDNILRLLWNSYVFHFIRPHTYNKNKPYPSFFVSKRGNCQVSFWDLNKQYVSHKWNTEGFNEKIYVPKAFFLEKNLLKRTLLNLFFLQSCNRDNKCLLINIERQIKRTRKHLTERIK